MVRNLRRTKALTGKSITSGAGFPGKLISNGQSDKITSYFSPEVPVKHCENNIFKEPSLPPHPYPRVSPRKHASTISVLQLANNNVTPKRSPHKIEMKTEEMLSLPLPDGHDTPKKESAQIPSSKSRKTTKGMTVAPSIIKQELPNDSIEPSKKVNSKLTDYFPVRRSVRKTKKTVQEEIQKNIENAILSKKEEGLAVQMFCGKGRGVVATRSFSRGEFVVEYAGELITTDEAKMREQNYALDQSTGCYMYYFTFKNSQFCVDATAESDRLGRLVNHSRNGNLITKTVVVKSKPHLVLVAKDHIEPGEELTYDYGDRSKESLRYHPWLAY